MMGLQNKLQLSLLVRMLLLNRKLSLLKQMWLLRHRQLSL